MNKNAKKELIAIDSRETLTFDGLVSVMVKTNAYLADQTTKAVNMSLTARNWLFGMYIYTYEQEGKDRAAYGEQLFDRLAGRLQEQLRITLAARTLRLFRLFFMAYPQLGKAFWQKALLEENAIWQSVIAKFKQPDKFSEIWQSAITKFTPPAHELLKNLSFTALAELCRIDDPLKRAFYELEAIRGNWSVRELKRQIGSLLYERTGLSTDKELVVAKARRGAEPATPAMTIRDPYVFEFLGIRSHEALDEAKRLRANYF